MGLRLVLVRLYVVLPRIVSGRVRLAKVADARATDATDAARLRFPARIRLAVLVGGRLTLRLFARASGRVCIFAMCLTLAAGAAVVEHALAIVVTATIAHERRLGRDLLGARLAEVAHARLTASANAARLRLPARRRIAVRCNGGLAVALIANAHWAHGAAGVGLALATGAAVVQRAVFIGGTFTGRGRRWIARRQNTRPLARATAFAPGRCTSSALFGPRITRRRRPCVRIWIGDPVATPSKHEHDPSRCQSARPTHNGKPDIAKTPVPRQFE